MLGFFRRLVKSRLGLVAIFLVIGSAAFAMVAGDVTGHLPGATAGGGAVAKVGNASIGPAELRQRVQTELEGYRQQQPTLDMAGFVNGGGLDGALQRMVTGLAFQAFGDATGMIVSKKAIDGQIASIPGLQGPSGRFDPALYRRILVERKLTDAQVRGDIARDLIAAQLTGPTIGAREVPQQIALPYAALLLERRSGQVGVVPVAAVPAGAAPTDGELQTFYRRNAARYALPERRVARYAVVTPAQVAAQTTPTDAEIAQAYQAGAARYAATEKRTIAQVVVADQNGANALAAKVRAGTALAEAARAAGLEASTQTLVEKPAYAAATSPEIATAVFGAAKGAVVGPVRGPLGYTVARVEAVEQVAARSLAQVRGEIAAALTTRKTAEALQALRDTIDSALAENATFDEVVTDRKLAAQATPAVTAQGSDPTQPGAAIDPKLAPVVAAAFQSAEGDAPQLVALPGTNGAPDGSFALTVLSRIVPAAPRPIAEVREQVGRDFTADRRRQAARRIAAQIVAKVNGGASLAQALSAAGVALPAARPIATSRADVARAPQTAQGPLVTLFSLQPGKAQLVPANDGSAFAVVRLEGIQRVNPAGNPAAIAATRADFGRLVGREYAEQFVRAIRDQVGTKVDPAAVARVRADLLGQGSGQ